MQQLLWINNEIPLNVGLEVCNKARILSAYSQNPTMLDYLDREVNPYWEDAVNLHCESPFLPPAIRFFWLTRIQSQLIPYHRLEIWLDMLAPGTLQLHRHLREAPHAIRCSNTKYAQ
jgi:hypothetical protein